MASAEKQAARNREILIAKARGEDVEAIATRHDLSPTRIRQILAAGTAVLAGADAHDGLQVALQRRAEYEGIYEKALALYEDLPNSNPSPKVGALRLALTALDRLATWDQTIGFVPTPPTLVSYQLEVRKFMHALLQGLEAAGIPDEAVEKVMDEITGTEEELPPVEVEPPVE
jgi:hypothetical protein